MNCPKCQTKMYPCYEADSKTLRGWAHPYTPVCHNEAFIRVAKVEKVGGEREVRENDI